MNTKSPFTLIGIILMIIAGNVLFKVIAIIALMANHNNKTIFPSGTDVE